MAVKLRYTKFQAGAVSAFRAIAAPLILLPIIAAGWMFFVLLAVFTHYLQGGLSWLSHLMM